jgi:hypothetical protein
MEYKRNRRVCPSCKIELPMLPRPMYMQHHLNNLWKIEKDPTKHLKQSTKTKWISKPVPVTEIINFERKKPSVYFYKKK